jgi:hypothetical protein
MTTTRTHNDDPAVRELEDLAQVAGVGKSSKTPLVLGASIWILTAAAFLVLLLVSVLAFWVA